MKIQVTITIKVFKRGFQVRVKEFGNYNNFSSYQEAIEFAENWKDKFETNKNYDYNVCIINLITKQGVIKMDKKIIEKSIKQSWEIEGLVISPEANVVSGDYLDGKISAEKAIELIKENHINEGRIKC